MPTDPPFDEARHGYSADFESFHYDDPTRIVGSLRSFVRDASPEQLRAWKESVPDLQIEAGEIVDREGNGERYTAVLEYEMPMEQRRADVVFLVGGAVVVLELKGSRAATLAALDQAAAYARDLRNYHAACEDLPVYAVVVPTGARGLQGRFDGVYVCGPDAIDDLLGQLERDRNHPIDPRAFLDSGAYRPLPTLVRAARELFETGSLRRVRIASAQTEPACALIKSLVREAQETGTRKLVLLAGIPGAGKTLVGLQTVHGSWLDGLAVPRADGRTPTAPAVFLSGNGPLVEVLQYELRAVGDGKTFVRGVKDYVKRYSRPNTVPPEHVLVFDEAQRAWDAQYVDLKHADGDAEGKSEPEHFVEFAERIPKWGVVVALIGSGQEIHVGEEGGVGQWRTAIERSTRAGEWQIHGPSHLAAMLATERAPYFEHPELHLDTELRFHMAREVHRFVDNVVHGADASVNKAISGGFSKQYALRITRSLDTAKAYLRERFDGEPEARFGLMASSRDKSLEGFGIENGFQATKNLKLGRWFADGEDDEGGWSCRNLRRCITEFQCQGLETDGALVAWGTDFVWQSVDTAGTPGWSNARARSYLPKSGVVKDALQLRRNAYRVLLTRARNATVVYVPELAILDDTFTYLVASGFTVLD